jgi:hypothetical protein
MTDEQPGRTEDVVPSLSHKRLRHSEAPTHAHHRPKPARAACGRNGEPLRDARDSSSRPGRPEGDTQGCMSPGKRP